MLDASTAGETVARKPLLTRKDMKPTSKPNMIKQNLKSVYGFLVALTLLLAMACQSRASSFVSGSVSGTWNTAGSPYVVTGNLTVPPGQTLTIQPGVTVIMGQGLRMDVLGSISAVGTGALPITIRGANASLYWDTIAVSYGINASRFANCNITDATNALFLSMDASMAGTATMTTPIQNCLFANCQSSCIYGRSHGWAGWVGGPEGTLKIYHATLSPRIRNCQFRSSSNACAFVADGTRYFSANNYFYGYGAVSPQIANCVFVSIPGRALSFTAGSYAATSQLNILNNVFEECLTAVQKSSSSLFDDVTAYNCFYNNQTNFVGFPPGVHGTICCANANGTACDLLNNIFTDPMFVGTTNYTLSPNSPCIDAGSPEAAYYDTCFPPSKGTAINDQGIYGGPMACGWVVVNHPPTIPTITNTNVDELTMLLLTVSASDPDPGQTLTYSLGGSIPASAEINATSGMFSWTPTEGQGPSTNRSR